MCARLVCITFVFVSHLILPFIWCELLFYRFFMEYNNTNEQIMIFIFQRKNISKSTMVLDRDTLEVVEKTQVKFEFYKNWYTFKFWQLRHWLLVINTLHTRPVTQAINLILFRFYWSLVCEYGNHATASNRIEECIEVSVKTIWKWWSIFHQNSTHTENQMAFYRWTHNAHSAHTTNICAVCTAYIFKTTVLDGNVTIECGIINCEKVW